MMFRELNVKGAYEIKLAEISDERGSFARVWCKQQFELRGLESNFVQCNTSYSLRAGTLRGLHYQVSPCHEVKLIQCIRGAIYDIVLDLRPNSSTYKQWVGIELTEDAPMLIYVPAGCAHGYQTLADHTQVLYPVSHFYAPQAERGVRWDDPGFAIRWPFDRPIVSEKDANWPDFCDG